MLKRMKNKIWFGEKFHPIPEACRLCHDAGLDRRDSEHSAVAWDACGARVSLWALFALHRPGPDEESSRRKTGILFWSLPGMCHCCRHCAVPQPG